MQDPQLLPRTGTRRLHATSTKHSHERRIVHSRKRIELTHIRMPAGALACAPCPRPAPACLCSCSTGRLQCLPLDQSNYMFSQLRAQHWRLPYVKRPQFARQLNPRPPPKPTRAARRAPAHLNATLSNSTRVQRARWPPSRPSKRIRASGARRPCQSGISRGGAPRAAAAARRGDTASCVLRAAGCKPPTKPPSS